MNNIKKRKKGILCNQPANQPTNQPGDGRPTDRPTDRPINRPTDKLTSRPATATTHTHTHTHTCTRTRRHTHTSGVDGRARGRRQTKAWWECQGGNEGDVVGLIFQNIRPKIRPIYKAPGLIFRPYSLRPALRFNAFRLIFQNIRYKIRPNALSFMCSGLIF